MKIAVSIDNEVFAEADETARRMGISRSALYTRAVKEFTRRYKAESLTEQLNRIYAKQDSSLDEDLVELQYNLLGQEDW
jgi:metal-responsive CopG/Arc/MetJ family transcriptional regulator